MKEAAEFHSEIAKEFDNLYNESEQFLERYEIWTEILDRQIEAKNSILDAGCGSGVFSFFLAKKDNKVLGIDGAPEMIKICNQKKEKLSQKNVSFLESYIPLDYDQINEKFDAIISSSVIEYFEDVPEVLQNYKSFLKENGKIILSIPNKSGLYRRLERFVFNLTGRPEYLSFSKSSYSLSEFNQVMEHLGFELKEHAFFSSDLTFDKLLKWLLPRKYLTTLFIVVYQLKTESL